MASSGCGCGCLQPAGTWVQASSCCGACTQVHTAHTHAARATHLGRVVPRGKDVLAIGRDLDALAARGKLKVLASGKARVEWLVCVGARSDRRVAAAAAQRQRQQQRAASSSSGLREPPLARVPGSAQCGAGTPRPCAAPSSSCPTARQGCSCRQTPCRPAAGSECISGGGHGGGGGGGGTVRMLQAVSSHKQAALGSGMRSSYVSPGWEPGSSTCGGASVPSSCLDAIGRCDFERHVRSLCRPLTAPAAKQLHARLARAQLRRFAALPGGLEIGGCRPDKPRMTPAL